MLLYIPIIKNRGQRLCEVLVLVVARDKIAGLLTNALLLLGLNSGGDTG
jgi:hypothetical protein